MSYCCLNDCLTTLRSYLTNLTLEEWALSMDLDCHSVPFSLVMVSSGEYESIYITPPQVNKDLGICKPRSSRLGTHSSCSNLQVPLTLLKGG